ncbi:MULTISPECIES: glycosyltransferase [unclassified Pseudoxanthomonas]|uniref:glycosyltransferase n=1 Tax=unclassified Pseudoxanthomonas TaxID=2645906 RepID=UPI0030787307
MTTWLLLSRLEHGGLERVQLNLAKTLHARGSDIRLVAGQVRVDMRHELPDTLQVVEIARSGRAAFLPGLVRALHRDRPDVVFTTSNDVACLMLLLTMTIFRSTRVVVAQHLSLSGPRLGARGFKRAKLEVVRRAMRLLVTKADHIVAVSQAVARDMSRELSLPESAITVIHNPIVTADFTNRMLEAAQWPWPDRNDPTIVFVGRISAEKRLDLLLDSFQALLGKISARLLIAGTGPLHGDIQRKVEESNMEHRCKLVGFVHDPLPLIHASDVLVLPSDFEGFGNVLVEAMACGTQVIATDCPDGPAEILENGKYGQLVPVGDADALTAAILRSLTQEGRVPAERLRARASEFGLERSVDAYERIIYRDTPT